MTDIVNAARKARIEGEHDRKRRVILDAAKRVFARDGAKGLTMRAIASEAGYAAGAVYFYFDSRAAIMGELAIGELTQMTKDLKGAPTRGVADRAASAAKALAQAESLFQIDAGEAELAGSDRQITGKLITLFQAIAEPLELDHFEGPEANKRALAFAAAVMGLAQLERSGWLDKLGLSSQDTLDILADRLRSK
jgi:AcrR family transcriptional regulator